MTQITRHLAGPGCGKTTKLLEFIRDEIRSSNLSLFNLYFCTFSVTQCNDVRARFMSLFKNANPDHVKGRVKTVHGLVNTVLRQYGLFNPKNSDGSGRDLIITERGKGEEFFDQFARSVSLAYSPGINDPFDEDNDVVFAPGEVPIGNLFFGIARYMVSSCIPWKDWPRAVAEMRIPIDKTRVSTDLFIQWAKFKKDNHLFEHDDYLQLALDAEVLIDPVVLLVDEFQDLSPLQFKIFKIWVDSGLIKKIFIAGDPNQCIYAFRGCDPGFMSMLEACDTWEWGKDVPISHRCPADIIRVADSVLQGRSYVAPKCEGGIVEIFSSEYQYLEEQIADLVEKILDVYHQHGEVMILTRFKKHSKRVSEALTSKGIPHSGLSDLRHKHWKKIKIGKNDIVNIQSVIGFLRALSIYRSGPLSQDIGSQVDVTVEQVKEVLKLIKRKDVEESSYLLHSLIRGKTESDLVTIGSVLQTFPNPNNITVESLIRSFRFPPWFDMMKEGLLNHIKSNLRISPNSIKVDTIHQSKGSEAEAVIVVSAYHKNRYSDCKIVPKLLEEERRVYYVALTRAKERVVIINKPQFSGVISPVLEDVISSGGLCYV